MVAIPGDVFGYYCWAYAPAMKWVEAADVAKGPLMQGSSPPGSSAAESSHDAQLGQPLPMRTQ